MSAWSFSHPSVLRWTFDGGDGIVAAVSTRRGGVSPPPYDSLNLGRSTGDAEAHVDANRARFLRALGAPEAALARIHQVHGGDLLAVDGAWREDGDRPHADGLITRERGRLLVVTIADCVPVFVVDATTGTLAVVHAGWRGTVAGIAASAVRAVAGAAGAEPRALRAAIGPSIGPCCFEVGDDVAAHFPHATRRPARAPRAHVDLWKANADQLAHEGIPRDAVDVAGLCTSCTSDVFFSHRRDHGRTGRMIAVLGRL